MTDNIKATKVQRVNELPFIIRAIWFFLFGWELTAGWILAAWILNVTIIGLPLGVWMLDRVPQVLTLKSRPGAYISEADGRQTFIKIKQPPFIIRALYFIVFGWWFSLIWALLGWLLCLTIIGLPLGVIMLNTLPAVTTLQAG
ncbi:MAG: YccF domain-containing protein [Anaerolineales bacterium]|nr:YccF domain-containing protein [Anaerolineales bacterium]